MSFIILRIHYSHLVIVVKAGYPPHSLTLIPELPLESLGLKQGEQLIVTQKLEASQRPSSQRTTAPASTSAVYTTPATGLTRSQASEPVPAPQTNGPDHVETEGGYLVHRVRDTFYSPKFIVFLITFGQIVPDDNSCLFSSVALVFEQDIKKAQEIRKSKSLTCIDCDLYGLLNGS